MFKCKDALLKFSLMEWLYIEEEYTFYKTNGNNIYFMYDIT